MTLLAVLAAARIAVGWFPTDGTASEEPSWRGVVHLLRALVAFAAVSWAAIALRTGNHGEPWVGWVMAALAIGTMLSVRISVRPWFGLIERCYYAAMLASLVLVGTAALTRSRLPTELLKPSDTATAATMTSSSGMTSERGRPSDPLHAVRTEQEATSEPLHDATHADPKRCATKRSQGHRAPVTQGDRMVRSVADTSCTAADLEIRVCCESDANRSARRQPWWLDDAPRAGRQTGHGYVDFAA